MVEANGVSKISGNSRLQNKGRYSALPLVLLCAVAFVFMFSVFANVVGADTPIHNEFIKYWMDGTEPRLNPVVAAYPIYHYTIRGLYEGLTALLGRAVSIDRVSWVYLTLMNVAAIWATRGIIRHLMKPQKASERYVADVLSLFAVFVGGIGSFLTEFRYYSLQGAPNVWHNPTVLTVRPFGLLSFLFFIKALDKVRAGGRGWREFALFGLFTFISCYAKPNYAFTFLPAMAIYIVILLVKDIKKNLLSYGVPALVAALPSAAVLLSQFVSITAETTYLKGITLRFGGEFNLPFWTVIGGTVSVVGFILYVFVLLGKRLFYAVPALPVSFFATLFGWFQFFWLSREISTSGDFFWGYLLAASLTTTLSAALLIKYETRKVPRLVGIFIYGFQLVNGISYAYLLANGGYYWQ